MNGLFLEGAFTLTEGAGQIKIYGVAIHPGATHHPNETFDHRVYVEEELQKAVKSLIGKPLLLDHNMPLDGCSVTEARWDDKEKGVYFEALITPQIAAKIRNGFIKKVSVNCNPWRQGGGIRFVDGVAPFGFEFDELSLLENMTPGDTKAWVKLAEAMESQEMQIKVLRSNLNDFREDTFRKVVINPDLGVEELHAIPKTEESYQPIALFFYKIKGWTPQKVESWLHDNPQYAPQVAAPLQVAAPSITESIKDPPTSEQQKPKEEPKQRALTASEYLRKRKRKY